jgi:hypothetical protein
MLCIVGELLVKLMVTLPALALSAVFVNFS